MHIHDRRLLLALFVVGALSACAVDERLLTTKDASAPSPDVALGPDANPDVGNTAEAGVGEGGGGTHVCNSGQTRCSMTGLPQKCNATGTAFEDQSPCPSSMPLCDSDTGLCAQPCMPQDKRCNPAAPVVQQCDLQGVWRDTETCDFACGGSGSATMCRGMCMPGTRSCRADNTPLICDETGTEQPLDRCDTLCSGGMCIGQCRPGATRCATGATSLAQTCDATGSWSAATSCTFVCDPTTGDCGGECVPGAAARCSGNTVQTCDGTGHWQVMTTCQGTPCSRGQCRACTAGEKQCNASKPQTCSAAGVWTDDQAAACQFTCDATSGLCTGECVPGTDSCTGMVSKHCDATGTYGPGKTCPNVCVSTTGRCGGVCVPNTHRCNGQSAETCGPDGQWASGSLCSFGCDATTGLCKACTDEPMAMTCASGRCGPTVNNCNNVVQCPSTCSGTGQSCGGAGVTGVCGCAPEASGQTCQNGARCGNVVNNCGVAVACADNCVAPQTCGGGSTPNTCGCLPKTMAVACAGKNCDPVSDGCGGMINCGACTMPQTCGGATPSVPNMCGCTSRTPAAACGTRNCGTVADGCGGMVSCGTMAGNCPGGQICANGTCAATCTPATACPAGDNCGTVDNGCNTGRLTCGTMSGNCPAGQTCSGGGTPNVCGCTPLTMAAACAGKCGMVSNGCSGMVDCGTACPTSQTCGGGGTTNVCGCAAETDSAFCLRLHATCNLVTATDNCGVQRTAPCGNCPAGQGCCGNGGTTCVTLTASPNCGACGVNCDAAHACSNSACRLVNGQRNCTTATDCVSPLPCTRFFTDLDGDGQGDVTKPVTQCGTTPGVGLVANSTDCCDTNVNVKRLNPVPLPDQGPWFDVPATNCPAGHLPFDYDCDGRELIEFPNFSECAGEGANCGNLGTWSNNFPIPACGQTGQAVACLDTDDGQGCVPFEPFFPVQGCR